MILKGDKAMNEKFFNLDDEKKERIINAAMEEFTSSGYDKASTNNIVKNACISKGLLFHYFGSKKKLYIFLYSYGLDIINNKFKDNINFDERDILKLFKELIYVKMELLRTYPNLFDFFISCYLEKSEEIIQLIQDNNKNVIYNKIYNNIDYTLFKDGLDIQKTINIMKWTLEQYSNEYINKIKALGKELNPDEITKDINGYIEIFKTCFYK
jgi:AcrR family transcriptional regulator